MNVRHKILPLRGTNGGVKSVVEGCVGSVNAVVLGILEVRVGIHGDTMVQSVNEFPCTSQMLDLQVNSLNDRIVGGIDPSSPCVDVGDLSSHLGIGEECPDLTNIVDKRSRIRTSARQVRDTSRRDTVKIL